VPKFCRHGTAIESCPICRPSLESAQRAAAARAGRPTARQRASAAPRKRTPGRQSSGLVIRHERRAQDDGYRSALAPGLRSSADAERLADEIAQAMGRVAALASDPPGLYAEIAHEPDIEEASWLAFLVAYLCPLEASEDPFAAVRLVRTAWSDRELPRLEGARLGPRTAHDPARSEDTLIAYRRWAGRAGSQAAAFTADPGWTPAQRFERVFERLALPGLHRRARYDLLVTLGALGRYPLSAPSLLLSEDDTVSRAAKRVFGIGDRLTLERRARALAQAAQITIAALDLALDSWASETRISLGSDVCDEDAHTHTLAALGC
jgi:hypothetical protein